MTVEGGPSFTLLSVNSQQAVTKVGKMRGQDQVRSRINREFVTMVWPFITAKRSLQHGLDSPSIERVSLPAPPWEEGASEDVKDPKAVLALLRSSDLERDARNFGRCRPRRGLCSSRAGLHLRSCLARRAAMRHTLESQVLRRSAIRSSCTRKAPPHRQPNCLPRAPIRSTPKPLAGVSFG